MSSSQSNKMDQSNIPNESRRRFFFNSFGTFAVGSSALCAMGGGATANANLMEVQASTPARPLSKEVRDAMTPDQIIALAMEGNRRFIEGKQRPRDLLAELKVKAEGQFPAAVMLSCVDSRAPAELIFDLGLGDLFNCRVAGNVETPELLGSMEFATKISGAKVVAVLGHSSCGAVKGAIAGAKLGNLTQLLAKLRPAIEQTEYRGQRVADNMEFVDAVARKNVELTVDRIRLSSYVIADLEQAGEVKIVGGFFELATGKVEFFV